MSGMAGRDRGGDALLRAFARDLAKMRRDLRNLEAANQISSASIEGGTLDVYDDADILRERIGKQANGSYGRLVLDGPVPPIPSEPDVQVISDGVVAITWDGRCEEKWPFVEFEAVRVHLVEDPVNEVCDRDNQVGVIRSHRGETIVAVTESDDDNPVYARLVAVSAAGHTSDPSPAVLVDELDEDDLDEEDEEQLEWEADDYYVLAAADITAGTATMPLSHEPEAESLTCVLAGVPQRPVNYTIDYDTQTLTITLSGWEKAGYVLWVHYAIMSFEAPAPEPTIFDMGCTATASGDVEGQAASFASYTITGTQPVWSDDSDASYITFTGRWGLSVANDLAFARAILDKPACLSASDSVRVAVVWRQSNAPYAADDLVVGLSRDPGSSYSATGVSENTDLVAPAGWRIAELSPYVSWSSAIADWLAARAYVGFYNNFSGRSASEPADPTYESHTISEVRVVVIPT